MAVMGFSFVGWLSVPDVHWPGSDERGSFGAFDVGLAPLEAALGAAWPVGLVRPVPAHDPSVCGLAGLAVGVGVSCSRTVPPVLGSMRRRSATVGIIIHRGVNGGFIRERGGVVPGAGLGRCVGW